MDSVLKSVNTDVVSKITVKPDGTWTASAACNGATSSNGLHHSASNGSGGAPEPKSGAKSEAVCVDILSDNEVCCKSGKRSGKSVTNDPTSRGHNCAVMSNRSWEIFSAVVT